MALEHIPTARILVVDDSQETLSMLRDALSMSGFEVDLATSGRSALNKIHEDQPDLVLMDAKMPGMDGFETCEIIKGEPGLTDIPVIFMTGSNETSHVVRALASGGVDFVTKPLPLDELFARIQVHLANARKAISARKALDRTGRRIVATTFNGEIRWATHQAESLLIAAGLRHASGDRLPWEVVEWLQSAMEADPSTVPSTTLKGPSASIEFRLLDSSDDSEILLRLVDCTNGGDEERLSDAFGLTIREASVLIWITHGKSNKEIAEILEMSPRTVNKHLEQIFNKLGIENRTAAATMAVRVLWSEL